MKKITVLCELEEDAEVQRYYMDGVLIGGGFALYVEEIPEEPAAGFVYIERVKRQGEYYVTTGGPASTILCGTRIADISFIDRLESMNAADLLRQLSRIPA